MSVPRLVVLVLAMTITKFAKQRFAVGIMLHDLPFPRAP